MSKTVDAAELTESLAMLSTGFKLPTVAAQLAQRLVETGNQAALPVVVDVFERELDDRQGRRVERLRRASDLPEGKTFASFDEARVPKVAVRQLKELSSGAFLDQGMNVLAFGLPGRGKTHGACALGHALVNAGHPVRFIPTFRLVQELLVAKRDLKLQQMLKKLDGFELLILDDIGYVQQSTDEVEVLFNLLAERYERRSTLITSNLVFSQWDRIFKNQMTTAAAIDRLVHHSVIIEFSGPSIRREDHERNRKVGKGKEKGKGKEED